MEVYAISCTWLRSKPEIKLFFRDLFVAICYEDGVRRLVYPIYYAHAFDVCLTNLTSA